MKTKTLCVIQTCVCLLLVQVLDSTISHANIIADSGQRVLNGEIADPADFPFLVRLHAGDMLCGGSVISDHFILTAAHCVISEKCSAIKIFPSTWVEGAIPTIQAVQCYPHENYVTMKFFYEIALIKTSDDILADGTLKAIPLPAPGTQYAPGTPAVVVGWGKTESGTYPGRLLRGDVQVIDWETCNSEYKKVSGPCNSDTDCPYLDLPRKTICTRGQDSSPSATCSGDSGGPFIIDGVLAGIVYGTIFFDGVCGIGTPSMNTNVAEYLPWIYSIIEPDRDTSQISVGEQP